MKIEDVRVLIADGDNNLSNRLRSYLSESGFNVKTVGQSHLLQKVTLEWRPHFLFIDLMFPGYYAQKCLQFLSERQLLGEDGVRVIVMSSHSDILNVKNCLKLGADDFIVKPLQMIDILQRLSLLSQTKKYNFQHFIDSQDLQIRNYFEMIQLLIKAASQDKNVTPLRFELVQMVSMALKAVRTSIVKTNREKDQIEVICSSDDPSLHSLQLDLKKYPELQYVLRTEKPLFIESLHKDATMSFVKGQVKSITFDSMMVLPLNVDGVIKGCLSVRMPKDSKLSYYDVKIAEIAAQLIAMTWKFENDRSQKKVA